jgi:WD40 repeat protein
MMPHCHPLIALSLALLLAAVPAAADPPRTDALGDPLPAGAIARLGTNRLWHEGGIEYLALSPDGRIVATAGAAFASRAGQGHVRLWDTKTGKFLRALDTLGQPVGLLTFSPDGKLLAGAAEKEVRLWDVDSGKLLRRLLGHKEPVVSVSFSADSRHFHSLGFTPPKELALHADGGEVCRWDAATGKLLRAWKFQPAGGADMKEKVREVLLGLALSADGNLLLKWVRRCEIEDKQGEEVLKEVSEAPRLYSLKTGKQVGELPTSLAPCKDGPTGGTPAAARPLLSRDGRCFAIGDANGVRLGCTRLADREVHLAAESLGGVPEMLFSPNSKALATASPSFPIISLWDAASGKKVRDFRAVGARTHFTALAFAGDGRTLAAASGPAVFLWDVATGKARPALPGHRDTIYNVCFSPDGRTATSAGETFFCRWNMATRKELGRLDRARLMGAEEIALTKALGEASDKALVRPEVLGQSPDGRLFVKADPSRRNPTLCEQPGGKVLRGLNPAGKGVPWAACFSSDGRIVVLLTGSAREGIHASVQQTRAGKVLGQFIMIKGDDESGIITAILTKGGLAVAPEGKYLAWNSLDKRVWLAAVAAGKIIGCLGPRPVAKGNAEVVRGYWLIFSPDGKQLAARPWWSMANNSNLDPETGAVHIWEVPSGREIQRFVPSQPDGGIVMLSCAAFSRDGRTLAIGQIGDACIRLVEVASGQVRRKLTGHLGAIHCLVYSPDGRSLASGSEDGTVLLWDVRGQERRGVSPPVKDRRDDVAPLPMEQLWADLAGSAPRADAAIRTLLQTPQASVTFLASRLQPAARPDPALLQRLLADLGSEKYVRREKAFRQLRQLGQLAEPALQEALQKAKDVDCRRRLNQLLHSLNSLSPPAGQLRQLRAVEVLEEIGTPEARIVLRRLAGGLPGSRLTREAQASLARLCQK